MHLLTDQPSGALRSMNGSGLPGAAPTASCWSRSQRREKYRISGACPSARLRTIRGPPAWWVWCRAGSSN